MQCVMTFKNVETCCIECDVLSYVHHLNNKNDDNNSALFVLHVFGSILLSLCLKVMLNFINTTD